VTVSSRARNQRPLEKNTRKMTRVWSIEGA
jgi:hypothetical protein